MKRTNDFKIFLSMVLLLFFGQTSFAQCIGGAISTSTDETMVYTCPGDGQSDLVVFQNTGSQDSEYAYLVTDANDIILEIVDGNSFDFENAPLGECHVWGVAYTGNFLAQPGQSVFGNMFSDECYNISYKCITVFRVGVDGGNVSLSNGGGDVANICLNDGGSDLISFETTSSSANYTYVVTDENNNILAIPEFNFADLSSAPVGVCRVWGLSYTGTLIAQVGQNAATVELADNCFDLSDNFITVYRNEVDGGAVQMPSGNTYIEHCVGDGNDDIVMFTNNSSTTANYAYFITDINNNILAVSMDDSMDFDGVPAGTCLVWGMSYTGNIVAPTGTSVFSSPISDGCWDISSTAITVVRNEVNGGMLEGGPFEFTIDGNADYVSGITLTGNVGSNQAWVITDEQGNILGLPPMPGVVNFDGAGAGVCLIWSLSFEDGLQGAAVGNNASDLVGCYSLSNPITVTRTTGGPDVDGGTLAGGPFEFCVDGESDFVSGITLTGNTGTNSAWVITDPQGNILGLPPTPDAVDFDGAGAGVCLIWHLSYEMGLMGAEVGMNASDLVGNFDLSNSITVSRSATEGGTISTTEGVYNHRAVIANRLSGTISVINSATNEVIGTYDMPNGGEPMYVDYNNENNTVLVGDYNGYVVAFDGDDFSVQGSVEAGDGVFHMWISPNNQQLWINNELDKTVSVVNPTTLEQITTFSIPQDLLAAGYKPHDVIVMPDNSAAFVTMLGGDTEDYVVKYDATTFQETARQAVGQDPHVSLTDANDKLYVASQGSGEVKVLNRSDLSEVTTIAVPNAHGLGMNADGTYLYVGNISDGGTDATYTIDLSTNTLIGGGVDAPFSAPHNYAVTNDNNTMYLTHSGMLNNTVSVYSLSPTPTLITSLGVGFNPFGLATYSYMPETTELSICAGDGNSDAFEVSVEGAVGSNQGWIITDTDLNILGTPAGPTFDLEGAGAGVCLVWHISYEDGLSGMTEGMNAANLDGCYSLSNSITVNRTEVAGGTLEGGPFEFIVDGESDFVSGITLTGNQGANQAWVITDPQGNILGLPPMPGVVDFDAAGAGVCLIWSLSFEDGLEGAEVGMNAADLVGCYSLSNSITVTRIDEGVEVDGGILEGGPFEFCVDGESDFVSGITLTGNTGTNSAWVITDPQGNILGLPPMPGVVDFDAAGAGVCLIWHLSFEDGLMGAEVGMNASDLVGDYDLSNSITVTRTETVGGTLEGGPFEFIVDGESDFVSDITLTGNVGTNQAWVITDPQGNILGLPPMPGVVDFDAAGAGVCLIWSLSFEDGLMGAEVGMNASDLVGCYSLSNSITVTRIDEGPAVDGGILEGGPFEFCVDGESDFVSGITLTGNTGTNSAWVITDPQGNILGLPPMPSVVDFDAAGAGVCLIWHLSFEDGLMGAEVGMNASDLVGDYDLSNSITVTRTETVGGTLEGGPFEFIVDGESDFVSDITLTGNVGTNQAWVITDPQGNILGLPPMPGVVDFDAAGAGVCLIWSLSFEDGLMGAEVGMNASDLVGCYSLSNSITVTRIDEGPAVDGGILEGGPFEFCVDGESDFVSGITLTGNTGTNSAWVITDPQGNILGLPPMLSVVDFDAAGAGVCLIWHLSFEDGLMGAEVGMNASDLVGDYDLSNSITVTRTETIGGTLEGGPFEFIVDGESDFVSGITLTGNQGANQAWVITDPQGNILGLPPMPGVVDFDAAGAGVCLIWSLSFEDGLMGAEVGMNASDLVGCYSLSNSITVTRIDEGVEVDGGILEGGPFEFCVDGESDFVSGITLTGNTGTNSAWVITDPQGNILGLPPMPSVVDFDAAGAGVCLIWHLSFEDGLMGAEVGMNASDLVGDYDLSNSITVTRTETVGGTLEGGPFEFIVDGTSDFVSGITLTGNVGTNQAWVITDEQGNILGLPPTPEAVDFDGAGAGVCLIWSLSFEDGLEGAEVGMNASDLVGCYSLSNSITVTRIDEGVEVDGGILEGGPFEFCVDGESDFVSGITLTGNTGTNSAWVITDPQGNILGLPPMPSVVDFDAAGAGVCLIWHLSYEDGLMGAEVGMNASDLVGDYDLSNSITVTRTETIGGTLEGGPFEFIVDGESDFVSGITLTGNTGTNQAWVITDPQGNILGLPPMPGVVDFDEAGAGVCLIWSLSFEDGLEGAEVGMNAADLVGCYSLSNSITVTRIDEGVEVDGGILEGGPFEFCVDGESDFVSGITLTGNTGTNSAWVITDPQGNILGLPPMPGVVDFDAAGAGVCLIWHLSFEDGLMGAEVGMNASDLVGDYDLSNSITVTRTETVGGTLEGGPFEFIVDGTSDFVSGITLTGNVGTNQAWVITDEQGNILGLPPTPEAVDFDGAGAGVCLIWSLSFEDGLEGAEVGMNASDLVGCYSLSNSITVTRIDEGPANGGIVINEINGNDRFEIKNTGTTTVDISNYWICDFPSYSVLSNLESECDGDLVLEPGEVVTLVSDFDISGDDGEFGLYLNTSWSDPNSIIDYVEWGSTGHTRANVAIAAGIWSSNDFVPAFPDPMSIHYDGQGDDASDWSVAMFSPCESLIENEDETELEQAAIQDMTVYPNPTKEVAMMTLDYMKDNDVEAQIYLLNAQGQVVQSRSTNLTKGNNIIEISLSNYPGGIYLLDVRAENIHETIRIVKQQM